VWIGLGRGANVAGRVGRRLSVAVNGVELRMRVAREYEVVMPEVIVTASEAQIEYDARAGRLIASTPFEPGMAAEQLAMGPDGVRVRDHRRHREQTPFVRLHAGHLAAPPSGDLADADLGAQLDAQLAGQADQRLGDRPGAAPGIPDPLAGLH